MVRPRPPDRCIRLVGAKPGHPGCVGKERDHDEPVGARGRPGTGSPGRRGMPGELREPVQRTPDTGHLSVELRDETCRWYTGSAGTASSGTCRKAALRRHSATLAVHAETCEPVKAAALTGSPTRAVGCSRLLAFPLVTFCDAGSPRVSSVQRLEPPHVIAERVPGVTSLAAGPMWEPYSVDRRTWSTSGAAVLAGHWAWSGGSRRCRFRTGAGNGPAPGTGPCTRPPRSV